MHKRSATDDQIPADRRVFVPREKRDVDGNWVFRTSDGDRYVRDARGTVRRLTPKVNGRRRKKLRMAQRRQKMTDPRKDQNPNDGTPGGAYPDPPENSKPFPAPGGAGNEPDTDTSGDKPAQPRQEP